MLNGISVRTKIDFIKEKIVDKYGFEYNNIRVFFQGEQREDHESLQSMGRGRDMEFHIINHETFIGG